MPRNTPGANSWLSQFLDVLHEFKSEIEERWSEYFEYQSLRYHCQIAEHGLEELLADTGAIYNLNIIVEPDVAKLNSIDLLFKAGLSESTAACPLGPSANELNPMEKQVRFKLLKETRDAQDAARAKANASAATVPARLTRKTIYREGPLTYLVGGQGNSTIVILNALGHSLVYWHRLLDLLLERHRIVIPDSPETGSSDPAASRSFNEQVSDLELILRREEITQAHLVGWCTGPKVAVAFYRRCPSIVVSLILLNSSFKCSGRDGEITTPYEHNLEELCRSLVNHPSMAGVVMKTFLANTGEQDDTLLRGMSGDELAAAVLARTNEDLKGHVLDPFHSPAATLNYSRRILDFLAYDAVTDARETQAPVLLVGAEYDSVASPKTTDFMVQQFPLAQAVTISGATHYSIYDRPRFVGDLIEKFLADLESPVISPHVQQFSSSEETLWT